MSVPAPTNRIDQGKTEMARRSNQLNVEGLETRDVMSGNVAAFVSSNTLYLNEAYGQYGQHNNVKVSQLASGAVRVTGLINASGTQTLINGAYYRDFYVPGGSLVANFGAGIDRLTVGAVSLNNVYADLGLTGVSDVDVIDINGAKLTGAMDLRTGGGADSIYVRSTRVGDGSGYEDLKINSGAGADYVQVGVIGGNFVEVRGNLQLNAAAGAEAENDIVKVNQVLVYHSLYLDTGSGNDTIQMGYTTAGEDIVITAGDGADKGTLTEVWAYDQFYVAMGTGNDTLNTTYLRANYLSLDGGYLGYDTLTHYLDGPTGQTWYTGWEAIN
jgi:hypothetical protein